MTGLLLLAGLFFARAAAAADLAEDFARLQSRVMAAQARIMADMAEQKRLARSYAGAPAFAQSPLCPNPGNAGRWRLKLRSDPAARQAQALLADALMRMIAANGLELPELCAPVISDDPAFLAWSTEAPSNGDPRAVMVIVMSRGMLSRLDDESELGLVLGHELSHLTLLHARADRERAQAAARIDQGLPWRIDPWGFTKPDEDYLRRWMIGADIGSEADADERGAFYMKRAGYDPDVTPHFFELYKRYVPQADDMMHWRHPTTAWRAQASVERRAFLKDIPSISPVKRLSEIQSLLTQAQVP